MGPSLEPHPASVANIILSRTDAKYVLLVVHVRAMVLVVCAAVEKIALVTRDRIAGVAQVKVDAPSVGSVKTAPAQVLSHLQCPPPAVL